MKITTLAHIFSGCPDPRIKVPSILKIVSGDTCTFFSGCNIRTRIVNGTLADKNAWPWLAALLRPSSTSSGQYCGATLISSTHVLTAAHCIDP